MCGIAGIVNFDGGPADLGVLEAMVSALRHRGPDGNGIYRHGPVGFAHTRLSVIDPNGGAQPFVDDEAELAMTYNGEVYNYVEIRHDLDGPFRTESDTEVVLRSYRKWGLESISRFRGMFAFAIHDQRKGKVYLVRDRVGIKPLYYSVNDRGVVFGSEISALKCVPSFNDDIDGVALSEFLLLQYVPQPRSIYQNVSKLRPAHFLEIDLATSEVVERRYWDTDEIETSTMSEAENTERFAALLDDTLSLYTRADVPFGAFLSGGNDSAIVAATMMSAVGGGLNTYTVGFSEDAHSELEGARDVARIIGADSHEIIMQPEDALKIFQRLPEITGEPFADTSSAPTFHVSEAARRDVTMVISGDGGDELFAGYNSYPLVLGNDTLGRRLMRPFLRVGESVGNSSLLSAYARIRARTPSEYHDMCRQMFPPVHVAQLTGEANPRFPHPDDGHHFDDIILGLQYRDINTYLVGDILTKVDRMSMANSLEVRVPMLDHKIVEFALGLPRLQRIRPGGNHYGYTSKVLLKELGKRTFSSAFLNRPKRGFGVPLDEWTKGPFKAFILDTFLHDCGGFYDWVDKQAVQRILDCYFVDESKNFAAAHIWTLSFLKQWFDARRRM